MEVDLVTHSGPKAVGSFVHTLVLTDVASGWTECIPFLSPQRDHHKNSSVKLASMACSEIHYPLFSIHLKGISGRFRGTLVWSDTAQLYFVVLRTKHPGGNLDGYDLP